MIDELSPLVLRTGDAATGKLVFKQQCAKCHTHSGEGGKIGPDLTGMAVHPKDELLVHILDPSRSVEGNFRLYTVATPTAASSTACWPRETQDGGRADRRRGQEARRSCARTSTS